MFIDIIMNWFVKVIAVDNESWVFVVFVAQRLFSMQ